MNEEKYNYEETTKFKDLNDNFIYLTYVRFPQPVKSNYK
jgi:hypothetical protein